MRKLAIAMTFLCTVLLSGCGTLPQERALSGGGIGAATGAVAGAILGGPVLGAAVLGGAAGAAIGGLTHKSQIDLGKPAWK